jgi:site-specific DNA recombinase
MARPAVYLRVSSDIQRLKESIQSQEQAVSVWLDAQGMTPDDVLWYRDDGISGKTPILERGDGARLAADIRAGLISGFVAVFSASRVARDVSDFHAFRELLRAHDLHLLGVAEGIDTRAETGDFIAGIHALIAEESHRAMMKAINSGKKRVAKQGKWQGRAPFGYTVLDGELIIDPLAAPVVRQIFDLYLSGHGGSAIINRLTAAGIPAPLGETWHSNAITSILTNRAYIGEATWNRVNRRRGGPRRPNPRSEHITIPCPAIIDKQTFDRAQAIRAHAGKRFEHTGAGAAHVLLSRVRCSLCNAPYNRSKYQRGGYYYRHSRYSPAYAACPSRNILAAALDDAVWSRCKAAIDDPGKWRDELARRHQEAASGSQEAQAIESTRRALRDVLERLQRAEDAYISGVMKMDRYRIRERDLTSRREALERKLEEVAEARQRREAEISNAATLAQVMAEYRRVTANPDMAQRQAIVERLIAAVKVAYVGDALDVDLYWSV